MGLCTEGFCQEPDQQVARRPDKLALYLDTIQEENSSSNQTSESDDDFEMSLRDRAQSSKHSISLYERLSHEASKSYQSNFLSYKDHMRFKKIESISEHYNLITQIGAG